jgi:dUTP pyrophosphatase
MRIMTSETMNYEKKYMHLKIFVKGDEQLKQKYKEYVEKHNRALIQNQEHIDAGFDIFVPGKLTTTIDHVNKLDFNIVCSAVIVNNNNKINTGYYMYPRSSLSKTSLRLANSVGIIDSGYRGNLIGMFDLLGIESYELNQYDRLVQVCAPGLIPIYVEIVDTLEDLGTQTLRGTGGFGSTGK